jgi:mannose-6-phosphate isomerase-like protein (cupin superfamily)
MLRGRAAGGRGEYQFVEDVMTNRFKIVAMIAVGAAFAIAALAQEPKATCNKCSATYIPNSEIQAYLKRADGAAVADQQIRAVDVGKTNVAIGVVYRGKLDKPATQAVAEHDQVSEVYHILDGSGTLVTGWDITDMKRRPADDRAVRLLNGPGGNGMTIRNGVTHQLKAGDMLVIPAGVGHWFTKIDDHIRYVMVRLDPDKVAPLKDEAASKADLASGEKGYR